MQVAMHATVSYLADRGGTTEQPVTRVVSDVCWEPEMKCFRWVETVPGQQGEMVWVPRDMIFEIRS